MVLYNNVAGFIVSPTGRRRAADHHPGRGDHATPTGALIDSRLAAGPVDMTWTADRRPVPNPTGSLISSFSSYGLSPDLSLKPDIGAPGGIDPSTYPLELGGYANLSGTSMASPHVAGASRCCCRRARTHVRGVRDACRTARTRSRGGAIRRSASSTTSIARARA